MLKIRENLPCIAAVFIIVIFSFIKLGQHPISPWDEARYAINSLEIDNTGNLLTMFYRGQPENWSFKPPFTMWCQMLSFEAFGISAFAMRFPSALAMLISFFFSYKITTLYRSPKFAAWTCLMLASVKGFIGWHAGRTGDTDAILTLFLLAFVYFSVLAFDFNKQKYALAAGLFTGMAFLVKGPASWALLPGMLFYLALTSRIRYLMANRLNWIGLALAIAFPIAWFVIQYHFGTKLKHTSTTVENTFEGMFSIELLGHFAISSDEAKRALDPIFFFYSLDKIFNLWHLAFFGFLAFGLFCFAKNRARVKAYMLAEPNRLLLLSLCLYFPLAMFLALATQSYRWYLTPVLPFVGIATFWGIRHFWLRQPWVKWAFWVLLAFTLSRQFVLFWNVKPKPAIVFDHAQVFENAGTIFQIGPHIEQDVLCYLYFFGKTMRFDEAPCPLPAGSILFFHKVDKPGHLCPEMKLVAENENYQIFQPE